jgi:hypothetical protein
LNPSKTLARPYKYTWKIITKKKERGGRKGGNEKKKIP